MRQQQLSAFEPQMNSRSITRTIVVKLETSNRKTARARTAINRWQTMAGRFAALMPTLIRDRWGDVQESWQKDLARQEFPTEELELRAHERDQALYKVSEAYGGWRERGCPGRRPQFGDKQFMRLCHCGVDVEENDRGYGLKISLEPYNPEWFHADIGEHQAEWLQQVVDGRADTGSAELHFRDGELYLHLTVTTDVSVYERSDISTWVGVDLGEAILYAAAVVQNGEVKQVEMERGAEFRHHRERLDHKREEAMRQQQMERISDERKRYTEQVTHRASRRIVKLAEQHAPVGIRIEDLTDYRVHAEEPIHDWPYQMLQSQIAYKATESRIPVESINPKHSSTTCRRCGTRAGAIRDGTEFRCLDCGYEVHADVNAAINIGGGGVSSY